MRVLDSVTIAVFDIAVLDVAVLDVAVLDVVCDTVISAIKGTRGCDRLCETV